MYLPSSPTMKGPAMAERSAAASIDEYLADFPDAVRERLEQIRAVVHEVAPDATETISYAIPTFDLNGKHLVHFAGFSKHVGLYPTPQGMTEFEDALSAYKRGKGSVQLPLDEPLPVDLIRRIVESRVAEVTGPR